MKAATKNNVTTVIGLIGLVAVIVLAFLDIPEKITSMIVLASISVGLIWFKSKMYDKMLKR